MSWQQRVRNSQDTFKFVFYPAFSCDVGQSRDQLRNPAMSLSVQTSPARSSPPEPQALGPDHDVNCQSPFAFFGGSPPPTPSYQPEYLGCVETDDYRDRDPKPGNVKRRWLRFEHQLTSCWTTWSGEGISYCDRTWLGQFLSEGVFEFVTASTVTAPSVEDKLCGPPHRLNDTFLSNVWRGF